MESLKKYFSEGKRVLTFLFEENPGFTCLIDNKGNILQANSHFLENICLSAKEIQQKNIRDFLPKNISGKIKHIMERMKKGEEIKDLKIKVDKPNGKVRVYEINGICLDRQEKLPLFLIITQDVTFRKKFKTSFRKFKTLFLKSPVGIELFDSNGENIIANEACLDLFGVTDRSSIKHISLFSSPFIPKEVKERIKKGETVRFEVPYSFDKVKDMDRYTTKKEEVIYLDVLIAPIMVGKEREIINYLVYIQDITERKQMERRIKVSLERSNFYKDLLTHDIGNILNNIKSSMQLMDIWRDSSIESKKKEEVLNIIKKQVERGSSLIENMRNISKLEGKKQVPSSIDVIPLLKKSIKLVQSRFPEKTIKINTTFPEESINVKGGKFLKEAFDNVLQNAIVHNKNNNNKQIWCEVSNILKDENKYVKIEFKDNGSGIPNDRKEFIFDRDYKQDRSTGGMGIGLSLVKKIVEGYGGKISVENRVKDDYEKGSNFIILLQEAR